MFAYTNFGLLYNINGGVMNKVKDVKTIEEVQYVIGTNIRNKCRKEGINIMRLAEDIGISYEYLRHIVSKGGKKNLSFYSMYKIALMLDMTMDELCEGIFSK